MQITLKEVDFSYHVGTPLENNVLSNITLTMGDNRIIAVVGKTGSGKSTFVQPAQWASATYKWNS